MILIKFKLIIMLIKIKHLTPDRASNALWNFANCPWPKEVTDSQCCLDQMCDSMSKSLCDQTPTCLWNQENNNCQINRDKENNVCCESKVPYYWCLDIMNGKCPRHFTVEKACCPHNIWIGILYVPRNYVCCRDPCNQIKEHCPHKFKQYNCIEGDNPRSYTSGA